MIFVSQRNPLAWILSKITRVCVHIRKIYFWLHCCRREHVSFFLFLYFLFLFFFFFFFLFACLLNSNGESPYKIGTQTCFIKASLVILTNVFNGMSQYINKNSLRSIFQLIRILHFPKGPFLTKNHHIPQFFFQNA